MTTSVSKPAGPSEDRMRPLGLVVIAVLVALASVGFGVIYMKDGRTHGIMAETVAIDIADTSVKITYLVAKGEDDEVRCTVDAFDPDFEILAEKEVVLSVGTSKVRDTETLNSPRGATGARIHGCRAV